MGVAGKTAFLELARLFEALAATTKRNAKKALISSFLRRLDVEEVQPAMSFLTGRIFPDADARVMEVGGKTIWKVLEGVKQSRLDQEPLTVLKVRQIFTEASKIRGKGSRRRKEEAIQRLLSQASSLERKYLIRLLVGEMRIGVVDGVALEAAADAASVDVNLARRAFMLRGNVGEVAELALTRGAEGLQKVSVTLFTPIKPMLAEMASDLESVFAAHGGRTGFEYKFDGARVQIHRAKGEIRIFSRRLTDVTRSVPEVVDVVIQRITAEEALLEGEVIAYGEGGKPLPFQDLMRRFRRIRRVEAMTETIPLRLYVFDVLYLNGALLIDRPYTERWSILSSISNPTLLADRMVTDSVSQAQAFLKAAVQHGHEGLMAKALNSPYTPGTRGKRWMKIKPVETLDLVVVAGEWGYGRRTGWLSNYHLAAKNAETGEYLRVGKTFKGLTDQEFEEMTRRLQQLKTGENRNTVYVKPQLVVEVAFNEIQSSPQYQAGFALRFARITRIRDDKSAEDVDTIGRVKDVYERQFRFKARRQLDEER